MVRLVLFGRQGAGKGTQSVRLAAHYGAPHISTGDMLRDAVAAGTDFGRKAKEYMDAGHLLPDDVILGIVEERLAGDDVRAGGFLLDGFPRTVGQAEALLALSEVDVAVDIDVPEAVVVERISSRRVCDSCGRIYSLAEPPSVDWTCDACGGRVVQRDDDTTEAVRKRLDAYAESTVPTIEWFAGQGLLLTVDGMGSPDEVAARIIAGVDERIQR